jgi:predicted tellurium resistance membrane protein TerC
VFWLPWEYTNKFSVVGVFFASCLSLSSVNFILCLVTLSCPLHTLTHRKLLIRALDSFFFSLDSRKKSVRHALSMVWYNGSSEIDLRVTEELQKQTSLEASVCGCVWVEGAALVFELWCWLAELMRPISLSMVRCLHTPSISWTPEASPPLMLQ